MNKGVRERDPNPYLVEASVVNSSDFEKTRDIRPYEGMMLTLKMPPSVRGGPSSLVNVPKSKTFFPDYQIQARLMDKTFINRRRIAPGSHWRCMVIDDESITPRNILDRNYFRVSLFRQLGLKEETAPLVVEREGTQTLIQSALDKTLPTIYEEVIREDYEVFAEQRREVLEKILEKVSQA